MNIFAGPGLVAHFVRNYITPALKPVTRFWNTKLKPLFKTVFLLLMMLAAYEVFVIR